MALLVKMDGTKEEVKGESPDGRLLYDQVRKLIGGGYLQHVKTDPDQAAGNSEVWLDEEGKVKRLGVNTAATAMSAYTDSLDILCGDVVFCTPEESLE